MSGWTIRAERAGDEEAICRLVAEAFAPMKFSDGSEAALVGRLRNEGDLILSLVAEEQGSIIGHIGFSPITVSGASCGWLQLAPLSVRADRQRTGIGTALIEQGLAQMGERGACGVGVEGDPRYYEQFGFVRYEGLAPAGPHAQYFRARRISGEVPEGEVRYAPAFY